MTDTTNVETTTPEQEVLPPETETPQAAVNLTREVFQVSSNLNVVIETTDGTGVTIENVVYAMKMGGIMVDKWLNSIITEKR